MPEVSTLGSKNLFQCSWHKFKQKKVFMIVFYHYVRRGDPALAMKHLIPYQLPPPVTISLSAAQSTASGSMALQAP